MTKIILTVHPLVLKYVLHLILKYHLRNLVLESVWLHVLIWGPLAGG